MPLTSFAHTYNDFYPNHHLPFCGECVAQLIEDHNQNWEYVDKLCQWAGIPFIVKEWERIATQTIPSETWSTYCKVFQESEYESIGWGDYYRQYKKLKEVGLIEEEIPEVRESRYKDLRRKWGEAYDDEDLNYLEDLYKGLLTTQNVSGALQIDQAQKLCKISLEINSRIRAGDKDVDKFMATYDKLIKSAEFTPKNAKNAADFDSFAEVAFWLEKHGRINKFYDNVTRDVIDETLKNIENYNQKLYVNEGGIGEEITERLAALKTSNTKEESIYDIQTEFDTDEYDNSAFIIDEDFDPAGGELV